MAEQSLNIGGTTETKPLIDLWWKAYSSSGMKRSQYDALVEAANSYAARQGEDCNRRYARLKSNGYRFADWEDALAYVSHVARIHKPRFRTWFEQIKSVFDRPFSLVVWTCGCGLDLIALHDWLNEYVKKSGHVFYDRITSITLLDISGASLDITEAVTQYLFPSVPVKTVQCDLTGGDRVEEVRKGLLPSFPLVRRVHFLFNWLDLLQTKEAAEAFARDFKEMVLRASDNANETCVAFSPHYSTIETSLLAFQSVANDLFQTGNTEAGASPMSFVVKEENKTYYATTFRLTRRSPEVQRMVDHSRQWPRDDLQIAVRFFDSLKVLADSACRSDVTQGKSSDDKASVAVDWMHLLTLLSGWMPGTNGDYFVNTFSWVRAQCLKQTDEEITYLTFLPKNANCKLLVVVRESATDLQRLRKIETDIKGKLLTEVCATADSECLKRICADRQDADKEKGKKAFAEWARNVRVLFWGASGAFQEIVYEHGQQCLVDPRNGWGFSWLKPSGYEQMDFAPLFVMPSGPDRLPSKDALYKEQQDLIDGQRTLRKIRGAPGTGKTTVLLHRVKHLLESQPLPVLVLCRTVALISHNERKIVASMADAIDRDRLVFQTCAKFMCVNVNEGECLIALAAKGKLGEQGCEACQKRWMDSPVMHKPDKVGAVLIDEAQLLEPEAIKAIYKATGASNPRREFYVFCDEEQTNRDNKRCLHTDPDESPVKKVVDMPDSGFGKFVTLKKNHRTVNKEIFNVCRRVQQAMSKDYDVEELRLAGAVEDEPLPFAKPFVRRATELETLDVVCELVDQLDGHIEASQLKDWSVTVLSDSVDVAKSFVQRMNRAGREVVTTVIADAECATPHDKKRKRQEQSMKRLFHEHPQKLHVTTIDSAQGQSFDMVILVMKQDKGHDLELLFTGVSRAIRLLWIVDATPDGWVEKVISLK